MKKEYLPKISIVTPSYNQGQFLEDTIQSVLNQGYSNLEYIIIDGCSTDNSVEIIKKYADKLAYWVSEPDSGQSEAINKGFRRAGGEILAWINSDDVYYPGVLARIAKYFTNHSEIDFLFGYHDDIDENGRVFRKGTYLPYVPHAFRHGFAQICQPTSFWRRQVWEQCGPLDESIHLSMDYDLFCRVVKQGLCIRSIPIRVCQFRYHASSKSVMNKKEIRLLSKKLLVKYFPEISNPIVYSLAFFETLFFRAVRRVKRVL